MLLFWMVLDFGILVAHYKYDWLAKDQRILDRKIQQDKSYVILRSCWLITMVVIFLVMIVFSVKVFLKIYRVVRDQTTMQTY